MTRKGRASHWKDSTYGAIAEQTEPSPECIPATATGSVYFIRAPGHAVKIGYSTNVAERLKAIQTGCPCPILLVGTLRGDMVLERLMKQRFAHYRLHGEWFDERILPEVLELIAADAAFYPS